MGTILQNTTGFTPIIDSLADKYGLITAGVFGSIWRYCQMKDGVCKASQEKIAQRAHVNRRTVVKHIKILVNNGYLEDITPGRRNRPHIYRDTGKITLKATITAIEGRCAGDSQHCAGDSHPGVQEDHMKIVLKIENKIDHTAPGGDQLLETENPDSITNRLQESPRRKTARPKDYLDAIFDGGKDEPWTIPSSAGGADSFLGGPLTSFCNLIGVSKAHLPDKRARQWASELRGLAEIWRIGPAALLKCIDAVPESEFGWKSYSTPYQQSFKDDLSVLIGRLIAGGSPAIKPKGRIKL